MAGIYIFSIYSVVKEELILYLFTFIYGVFLLTLPKKKAKYILLFIILLLPSVIKIPILLLIGAVLLLKNFDKFIEPLNEISAIGDYLKHCYLFLAYFIYIGITIPILMPTFIYYHEPYMQLIDILLGIFYVTLLSLLIFWELYAISLLLFKYIDSINRLKNIKLIITLYIGIIICFFMLPDTLYALLYSYLFTVFENNEIPTGKIFYFTFLMHHTISMNDYYLEILSVLQNSTLLSILSIIHVITVKIVDTVIIASIILSLLGKKLSEMTKVSKGNSSNNEENV